LRKQRGEALHLIVLILPTDDGYGGTRALLQELRVEFKRTPRSPDLCAPPFPFKTNEKNANNVATISPETVLFHPPTFFLMGTKRQGSERKLDFAACLTPSHPSPSPLTTPRFLLLLTFLCLSSFSPHRPKKKFKKKPAVD
jgi:hypothetical protein